MYAVSEQFKQKINSDTVAATARITLISDNTVIDGENLVSVKIKDYCYNNGSIIGTAMAKEAEI